MFFRVGQSDWYSRGGVQNAHFLSVHFFVCLIAISVLFGVFAVDAVADSLRDNKDLGKLFQQKMQQRNNGAVGGVRGPQDQFAMADRDSDQVVSQLEYIDFMEDHFSLMRGAEPGLTWPQLSELMAEMADLSGVSIDPRKRMMMRVMFSMMDRDDSGIVDFSEYQRSLPVLMAESDTDQDGILSRLEFEKGPERVLLPLAVIIEDDTITKD